MAAGLVAGICFCIGFLVSSQTPKIRSWVLVKIEKLSRESLPVRILPGEIHIDFFPLGATIENVRILPKDEVKDILDPVAIEELNVTISPWQLMQGKLRVNEINLHGSTITVRVPPSKNKSGPPLEGLFDTLALVPINQIGLSELNLNLTLSDPQLKLSLADLALTAEKRRAGFSLDVTSAQIHVLEGEGFDSPVHLELETSLTVDPESVILAALKVRQGESFAVASGEFTGNTEALDFQDIELSARGESRLKPLGLLITKAKPEIKMPELKGRGQIETKVVRKNGGVPSVKFSANTEGLEIDQFIVDHASVKGSYREDMLRVDTLTIENQSGTATASQVTIGLQGEKKISGHVKAPHIQLHELLKTLGLNEVPVYLQFSGELPCEGTLEPSFTLTCKGALHGENLLVRPEVKSSETIVALRSFDAQGEVTVDTEKVSYSAALSMPNSKGSSQGTISYETGFKISYEANDLATKDIANLANLKLEGSTKIKGTTEGDSHKATLKMNIDGTDLWLEDFWLGNAKATASYKSGKLSFNALQGHFTVSRYAGDVEVDLIKNRIGVKGRVPFYDARDLLQAFSRKVQLPFPVTGTGQAVISVSGPFEFNKLSYDLKSSLFRGSVAGENFDQAHFDIRARNGEVETERVQVLKGPAVITLSGKGHPDGNIETVLRGRGLRVEDSAFIASSGLSLSGIVNFDMDLTGHVLSPDSHLKGSLTRTSIGDQSVPDSEFNLRFTAKTIEGGGSFLGDVLSANFVIPLNSTAPFSLKLRSVDWNYAPTFAALAGPGGRKDYVGRFSSVIDISSESGGFWNASGSIDISNFLLKRGTVSLQAPAPLALSMKNGYVQVKNFELVGDNTFLRLSENKDPVSKLDLQVNGKLDLNLLSLLTPFFEDLRGLLSFAFNLRGGPDSVELLGSAYLEKGYLKFFDFPHPFADIRADLLFNQKRVLFNSIRAEFGGGRLGATGNMEFKGYKNVPVNVTGTFDKVTLNVPDKVNTTGSGQFSFTGNWFPFLLKGQYDVTSGLITKEFGGETNDASGIRRSYFLPDLLLQDNFVPLMVDLSINFNKGLEIKNDMIEGHLLGALNVQGNPSKPAIRGTVTTHKDTLIFFRETAFEVTSANVQFTNSTEINPRLYVAARSRVQDHDINLLLQGTAMKPDLSLTSIPPLPDKDIISLLALGATDSQLNQSISSEQQASSTGLQIGTGLIKKNPISDALKKGLGVDVQFSAGFDDAQAAVQKIIVSRQFSQKLDISASQSFGKQRETEAKVRYRLNDRLSLVGSWQGREYEETSTDTTQVETTPNKLGLDVEYKFEFK